MSLSNTLRTYLVRLVCIGDFQRFHCIDHNLYSIHCISVDECLKLCPVTVTVALSMDNSHLLYESTLASFSGPWGGARKFVNPLNQDPHKQATLINISLVPRHSLTCMQAKNVREEREE